jgi:hypothetical protein
VQQGIEIEQLDVAVGGPLLAQSGHAGRR